MTDLDEAHGWMVDRDVALMPIARSLNPMQPRMVFFHTNGNGGAFASTPQSMHDSIARQIAEGAPSVIIPNFQVGQKATAQYKSIFISPSTQGAANLFGIGIETADSGALNNPFGGIDREPWNAYQLRMLAKIAAFCSRIGGVKLERPDAWNGHGCEGHCASNLIPGDTRGFTKPNVTSSTGKICPGHARLAQIPKILADARKILEPAPPKPPPVTPPVTNAPQEADNMLIFTADNHGVWLLHNGKMLQFSSMDTPDNAHGLPSLGSMEHGIPVADLDRLLAAFPSAFPSAVT